jgi:hypothetical protein
MPLRTLTPLKLSPLQLLASTSSPKAILGVLHRIPSVSRGFASPTLGVLQTLLGFPLSKVY